ncbi:type I-U CRISPR-associated protein Cas5/Cas6 [Blastopirellula marina]|uniref:Type I-U CRISPR-associated protein Cas5/Cas6 n=1 Tax=Blastopirellula marina TaxID=124 RepID=A0A2S8F102_9BACT|nr:MULTISPECIES: type I-U CRISPR-associated protein Csb2 [Pirellulaceae]PQO25813.1 type I-U CRISPR-associated protein Cas5/Cas6 [Blastopirellula marina]RCS43496.1 type I-U CRISPR-associated protein Cas5/Cas6 [Bremerella cremea]
MPTIEFTFPAHRYHATLTGTHVNEGRIEWPPSPWRLLRTFLAVGYTRLHWNEPPVAAIQLLEQLASTLPAYRVPRTYEAHSRHYMPYIEGKNEKTTKVIDAFLRFPKQSSLLVHYDVDLNSELKSLLESLICSITYLGRAESWTDAKLIEEHQPDESWFQPLTEDRTSIHPLRLLSAIPQSEYERWRVKAVQRAVDQESSSKGKKVSSTARKKLEAAFPVDLIDCLSWDTADVRKYRWNRTPGTKEVLYSAPEPSPRSAISSYRSAPAKPVEAALVALAIDRDKASRLPAMSRCLPQAEAMHAALVRILARDIKAHSESIIGRTHDGKPLQENHRHAHFVPLSLHGSDLLDHMLIHAPMGLDDAAQQAIRRLRFTWAKKIPRIVLRWIGFGSLKEIEQQINAQSGRRLPILGSSTVLHSETPYVPSRHLKLKRSRYTLEDDICRELASRGYPKPSRIEVWNDDLSSGHRRLASTHLLTYVRARQSDKPQPPDSKAFGLTLHFDETISCPLAIGYGSHYGLGLFSAGS